MAKEKHAVPVDIRLGDVEVAADEGYQKRIKDIVNKFREDLFSLAQVRLAALLTLQSGRFEPSNLSDLAQLATRAYNHILCNIKEYLPSGLA